MRECRGWWAGGRSGSFLHPFPAAPQRPGVRHVGWREGRRLHSGGGANGRGRGLICMNSSQLPIRTSRTRARAPFGGGLTAPGPNGRRVLRTAGAGRRRALPGGFGRFAGAASLGRRRPARGQPAGRAEGTRRAGAAGSDGPTTTRRQVRLHAPGVGRAAAAPREPSPSLAVQPPPRHLPAPSRGSPSAGRRAERAGPGEPRGQPGGGPGPTAGPLGARPAAGPALPPGGVGPAAAGAAPRPAALPLAEARPAAPARPPRLLFPAGLTGPGPAPVGGPDSPEARRSWPRPPGAEAGPARRLAAREQQPPRAREKLRLSRPGRRDGCTGESRARDAEGAPEPRSRGGARAGWGRRGGRRCAPGRWVWTRASRLARRPGTEDGTASRARAPLTPVPLGSHARGRGSGSAPLRSGTASRLPSTGRGLKRGCGRGCRSPSNPVRFPRKSRRTEAPACRRTPFA